MFKSRDFSTVRRRRTVEIEEEEIEDNDPQPVTAEPSRSAARAGGIVEPYKPGPGLYIIIGVTIIFLGFLFARAVLGDGDRGGGLPRCESLPPWNQNARCR